MGHSMKIIRKIFLLVPALFLLACTGDEKGGGKIGSDIVNVSENGDGSKNNALPAITFEETVHDFGKITQGERVKWSFKFKNTGNANLVISNVSTTCGCTIADYPRDPIAPGKEGKIDTEFNSDGKPGGPMERKVTVVSNCEPNTTTLTLKTDIVVPESHYSNEVK